jgi:hypothetical protein
LVPEDIGCGAEEVTAALLLLVLQQRVFELSGA